MKGLLLHNLNVTNDEAASSVAEECCKKGLQNDIKSFICWHVYGLLNRSLKDYKQASRCYVQALKLDPNNMNIWKDLSLLQVHTRDYQGFCETRLVV